MHTSPVSPLPHRGISLVEVLVAIGILSIVFVGVLGSFRFLLAVIANTRAEAGAIAIANEYAESVRALPYGDVGTAGGIPAGAIPQNRTLTLNDISYGVRTFIQYVDAPEDGLGASDDNGITADYKRAKIEVTWSVRGVAKEFSLITNIVPRGIETLDGGGTLTINVFDATVAPVEDTEVHIVNATTNPTIDVTTFTNAAGIATFPGAPAAGGYEIRVSKPGYSSAGTYTASGSNPNPNPPHVAVVESEVSTVSFAIDRTASLTVETIALPSTGSFADTFDDSSLVALSDMTAVGGGEVVLVGAPGTYALGGEVHATATAPSALASWSAAQFELTVPADTAVLIRVYAVAGGAYVLIPDTDLPGNAAGFTASPVHLSGLSAVEYPSIALGASLSSLAGADTPSLHEWSIAYVTSVTPVPNIAFTMTGFKSIGTSGAGLPVKKYSEQATTNGSGHVTITGLEWDQYTIAIHGAAEGYDAREICPPLPLTVTPASASTTVITLEPHSTHSLHVTVRASDGNLVPNANVRLFRSGYDETETSSLCGQAFFGGLATHDDYTVEVSAPGFLLKTIANTDVAGQTSVSTVLDVQ